MTGATLSGIGHLRVVAPPTQVPARSALEPALASAPFRPGELPQVVRIALSRELRDRVLAGAASARLPAEMWTRLAVEASRTVGEIRGLLGVPDLPIASMLDRASQQAGSGDLGHLDSGELWQYSKLLSKPHPTGRLNDVLALLLSEEMCGAWRRAATTQRVSLDDWVTLAVTDAPRLCVTWEIAAARANKTLAEWAYASALAAFASFNA